MATATSSLYSELGQDFSGLRTEHGVSLADCLRSGWANPDSKIGFYAGDAQCYRMFRALFRPALKRMHGTVRQPGHDWSLDGLDGWRCLDPAGEHVLSTRLRIGRNPARHPFPASVSAAGRRAIEAQVLAALSKLPRRFMGDHAPLETLQDQDVRSLRKAHLLYHEPDRFMAAAGMARDWPEARALALSADRRVSFWINEEDALRIVVLLPGEAVREAFAILAEVATELEHAGEWARDRNLGYLASCPSNAGTTLRVSLRMRLPELSRSGRLSGLCRGLGLDVRGSNGEHSRIEDSVVEISNRRRLGMSEAALTAMVHARAARLLFWEKRLAAG
ncbi:arginine kinase [Roseibium sp. RKSG952]|uniref:arginine kinase n=1 Tax=Roseibium sp. RKSG952 TaxID=2529384 RepID=UPI0012BC21BE|nr:arginine kinase [Roseibium sp. RKSG952]MTH97235.1 arginine kinase [Roseibium sp. RKSG952]